MTNYEKIIKIIESGHIAQVEYVDGNISLFSSIISNGDIRGSSPLSCKRLSYDSLGEETEIEENINRIKTKSITTYQCPVRYPKVGDMVEVLESFRQSPGYENFCSKYESIIGRVITVAVVSPSYCVAKKNDAPQILYLDIKEKRNTQKKKERKRKRK